MLATASTLIIGQVKETNSPTGQLRDGYHRIYSQKHSAVVYSREEHPLTRQYEVVTLAAMESARIRAYSQGALEPR